MCDLLVFSRSNFSVENGAQEHTTLKDNVLQRVLALTFAQPEAG